MFKLRNTLTGCAISFCFACLSENAGAQVNFTANDIVQPYPGGFHPSANLGEYAAFSEEELAVLAAGGTILPSAVGGGVAGGGRVMGAGVKSLRPGLFEGFMEIAGYDAKVPAFQYFAHLGMNDHTVIVGFPSPQHKDPTQYCPGIPSELFANLYEPIWDGGANGTPVNDQNYYALYLWKTVSLYKDYVRFWEIWNEPGFDYTGGLGFLPPGAPGNWWDNNPSPCDYKLRAPIFHYVRLLRISWEVIKTIDPEAFVVVSGTGFPSFLDAILRNTDNPADGSVSTLFPLKGGAYFDVMGFHAYPHFDGSLRQFSDDINDWEYFRHSDAAAQGLLKTKNSFQNVLANYGYDGANFPQKHWMITEVNLPRKAFPDPSDAGENFIGSAEAQRNFIIKSMATAMMNGFLQLHVYKLAEDTYLEGANDPFDLMGLYKRLDYNDLFFQQLNDLGVAHKTASDVLFGKTFDLVRTAQMNLGATVGGGAFKDVNGNFTYLLWAKTLTDESEAASATYSFPASMNVANLLKCEWNASLTHDAIASPSTNIALTGSPIFLTERIFTMNDYAACSPFNLQLTSQVPGAAQWFWTVQKPDGSQLSQTAQNPVIVLTGEGTYKVTLQVKNAAGQVIGFQTQTLHLTEPPQAEFEVEVSGPIARFINLTPFGECNFTWNFGDGTTSTEAIPTHVYLQTGNYVVTLTAGNVCGSTSVTHPVSPVSPLPPQVNFTANDSIPTFTGKFRPGTSWDYLPGWTDEQIANIAAGNPLEGAGGGNPLGSGVGGGVGLKALRTYIGESFFLQNGYDVKRDLFQHYHNIDLQDNTFLLAFPSAQSRDQNFYCPESQTNLFRDLYLDIWDGGANGTPVNEENPFALYVWNTVKAYGEHVKFWEIFNSPDYDPSGDYGWLPPGQLGNWWENNPDPCNYELRAPIFYYVRSLRIAYEIIHYLDPDGYVTISGVAYPSFLDAVCRNTDNPLDGSVAAPYPLKGGAYFDAVGFKSYPHFDGSTIYFDVNLGQFAYERHSDAAVDGIARVSSEFKNVLDNYGYDGSQFPEKEWIISEANIPRKQFYNYLGSSEAQRNWVVKAWVESVKLGIRQLDFFRLTESRTFAEAGDPFEVMGFYQKMEGVLPYNQMVNEQGIALKTCSDLLFGADFNQSKTAAMNLPAGVRGAAFQDAAGNFIYVLWAETKNDQSEYANATYSFPVSFGISQLHRQTWDFSLTHQSNIISPNNIMLDGSPVFLTQTDATLTPPVAFFEAASHEICAGDEVQFSSKSTGEPTHFEWTFEGGIPAAHFGKVPPPVKYNQPGRFQVSLLVKNSAGEHMATYHDFIEVQAAPAAHFQVQINGATAQFINLSNPPPGTPGTSYEWCYGDGFCNSAENPAYLYFANGDYLVTLTTSNLCGENTFSQIITIAASPTAAFQMEHKGGCASPQIQFLDYSFSNPENWQWQFPGGDPAASDLRYPVVNYPSGGWYEVTLIAGNGAGFDTLTKQVYVEGASSSQASASICEGGTYAGIPIFSDTILTAIFPTWTLGCDSTVVAEIDVTSLIETHFSVTICEGTFFHGTTLFADTVFVDTFILAAGCDSVSRVEVEVYPQEEVFLVDTISPGEFVQVGSSIFTQAGNYEVTLTTWQGCDSVVQLSLTVLTGVEEEMVKSLNVKAFPNPFSENVWLEMELAEAAEVSVGVFDGLGRLIRRFDYDEKMAPGRQQVRLDLEGLGAGIYYLQVLSGGKSSMSRVVKIRW